MTPMAAAHPNTRFTIPAAQCPTIADFWDAPDSVVIDATIFGGRRAANVPLVVEALDWKQGVFIDVTVSSEQTTTAEPSPLQSTRLIVGPGRELTN
jgi:phosphoenolpyruvate carboxykinase (GTP)